VGIVCLSVITYVYVDQETLGQKTSIYVHTPILVGLNIAMLVSVCRMQSMIKRAPHLIPNQRMFIVHLTIFGSTSLCWAVNVVYWRIADHYAGKFNEKKTIENLYNWYEAFPGYWRSNDAVGVVGAILNIFMFYMLY